MTKPLSELFVKRAIVRYLSRIGYSRNLQEKETGEHGIDIKVRHNQYPRYYIVEAKGDPDPKKVKHPGSRREVSFLIVLGQIVTRMTTAAKYWYGIGLPDSYKDKVFRRLPWRLCKKLQLNVLLVDKAGKVQKIDWKRLKSGQK